jgi:lysophospholipid acyltransferase (LPLAT)-like uncharacterized protein
MARVSDRLRLIRGGSPLKSRWRRFRPKVLAGLVFGIASLISVTMRWRVHGLEKVEEARGGLILSIWHGRTFVPANYLRNRGIWALFSLSNDGELQSRIFSLLGYRVIRGSTGRGGERAAIEAIRVLRGGEMLALTPDGPRGPAGAVQGGILLMAKKSGAAILPIGTSARPRWLVKTWDRYLIPMPFAKASVHFGEPIWLSKDATPEEEERVRQTLADAMNRLQELSDAEVGIRPA